MILELDRYRINIPYIKAIIDRDGFSHHTVAMVSATLGVPVVAVYHYVGELYGFTDDIHDKIKKLVEFYRYEEIK